ncbi:hypothetical protein D5085_10890 [Ectothiorhodospiraceae bacterium BW-2]|nr:hypothetical protein D5085_10890 [Ectothiorhodospiraceae bacterium BW-2]
MLGKSKINLAGVAAHIIQLGNNRQNYRIRDRYGKDVVSLTVLSDSSPAFKPDRFQFSLAGCEIDFRFPVVKLLDWRERL